VGTFCNVQFNTGAVVFLSGTLVDVKHDAIFLQMQDYPNPGEQSLIWIPKKNILFIQYKDKEKQMTFNCPVGT
jgi:hypothetical protein